MPVEITNSARIEIVLDVLLQHHSVQTRRWLIGLIPELKSRGSTTLARASYYSMKSSIVSATVCQKAEITLKYPSCVLGG